MTDRREDHRGKKILLIATGGTIASTEDGNGLSPALSGAELAACVPGIVLSILLLARLMTWLLRTHYSVTFHGILGVVLASTLVIIPLEYTAGEIVWSVVCCGGGFLLAYLLAKLDRRIEK